MADLSAVPEPSAFLIEHARRASTALYLEVPAAVADDVKSKVEALASRLAEAEATAETLRGMVIRCGDQINDDACRLAEANATIAAVEALSRKWRSHAYGRTAFDCAVAIDRALDGER